MQAATAGSIWDFTPVLNLIHSFAAADQDVISEKATLERHDGQVKDTPKHEPSLGNFDDIWKCIGYSDDLPVPSTPSKRVRWEDEVQQAALAGDHDKAEELIESSKLDRKEKKAIRRRVGRVVLQKQALSSPKRNLNSSSDDDPTYGPPKQSPNPNPTPPRRSTRLANKSAASEARQDEDADAQAQPRTPDRRALIHDLLERPLPPKTEENSQLSILQRPQSKEAEKWPTADPGATLRKAKEAAANNIVAVNRPQIINILKKRYLEEAQYLHGLPLLLASQDTLMDKPREGLHIFIDASNILIGFHDALKLARSLPRTKRIRRQQMSFQLLSLILSRGRPIAKRIVVGSDNCPEMVEAKEIGYEINILDRVHKAKELTPRQKKYANRENGGGGTTSAGSGSETMTAAAAVAQFAPEKWVEQGVDEILHLKMMESVVDAVEPSTMVLATGDAAEAEFSGGFMRMVERALGKGWNVELTCWKHNMSAAYRSHEFRQKWGSKFRIVELDVFAELIRVGP